MKSPILWLLAIVAILAIATVPLITEGTYFVFVGNTLFIYAIIAIGLNLLSGYAGQFSLGHAAFMAIGAYSSAILSKNLNELSFFAQSGLHIWLGVALGTILAGLAGIILAVASLRNRGPYLAMVTIAFGWVVWKILQKWIPVTGGSLGISGIPNARFGSLILNTNNIYYALFFFLLISLILQYRLVNSHFGRRIRALRHNEMATSSIGINVYHVKIVVCVISAAFAGFGGALFAHQQNYINPDSFQFFSSVFLLLMVLFGGPATIFGPVVGAAVLVLLPEMLHGFDQYRLLVYGCLILAALYFLPNGVAGLFEKRHKESVTNKSTERASDEREAFDLLRVNGAQLKVDRITQQFGGLKAISDSSFKVKPGSIHALIGPNGAGKTTMINIISGIYKPDKGSIEVDGDLLKANSIDSAAKLGIVRTFQTLKLFGDMTVMEHVLVGMSRHTNVGLWGILFNSRSARREEEKQRAQARTILNLLGISHLENSQANSLPYGHRRLVEIARALASRPRLLLLDEPAAGLIEEEVRNLQHVIRKLQSMGITILLVEHHLDFVFSLSENVTVLDQGIVIADDTPDAVRSDENVISAYIGQDYATT